MFGVTRETVARIRKEYPVGTRVELVCMYNERLSPGDRGTVTCVDDIATIHVKWDCGASLGVVYGEDQCRKITDEEV